MITFMLSVFYQKKKKLFHWQRNTSENNEMALCAHSVASLRTHSEHNNNPWDEWMLPVSRLTLRKVNCHILRTVSGPTKRPMWRRTEDSSQESMSESS